MVWNLQPGPGGGLDPRDDQNLPGRNETREAMEGGGLSLAAWGAEACGNPGSYTRLAIFVCVIKHKTPYSCFWNVLFPMNSV
jgi:hypothetical protein